MEIFLRKHTEGFLTGVAVALTIITFWGFIWGIIYVSQNLDSVFTSKPAGMQTISFNLSEAQNLNLKGLVPH